MPRSIRQLTESYADAFARKDLDAVAALMTDDFALEDPVVVRVDGKSKALAEVRKIFDGNPGKFDYRVKNIYVDGQTSVMEFVFALEKVALKGVDIIEWRGEQMREIRAYLDIPK